MIYLLAASLDDARSWCFVNGVERRDAQYVGQTWELPGRLFTERDRIVRTDLSASHPAAPELERHVEWLLERNGLTETIHGSLVRRNA